MLTQTTLKNNPSFRVHSHLSNTLNLLPSRPRTVSTKKNRSQYKSALSQYSHMNSIKKAVKTNDISVLIGSKREKLRTEPVSGSDAIYETAHDILIQVRKKYDDMKKKRVAKFSHNQKLKERVKTLSVQHQQLAHRVHSVKRNDEKRKQSSQYRQTDLQMLKLRKDIMVNMKSRLKQDIDHYKDKLILYKKSYGIKNHNITNLTKQNMEVEAEKSRGQKLLCQYIKSLGFQQKQREQHIRNMQKTVGQRIMTFQSQTTWTQFKNAIAVQTLQARDNEQKQWQNLILANMFVKHLLNNKISLEMKKFEIIQKSFTQIKLRTEVNSAESLVSRFLNRDLIYGELLEKVSECKLKKQKLLREKDKLIKENQKLDYIQEEMLNREYLFYNKSIQEIEESPQMKKWNEKIQNIKQTQNAIRQWITRQLLKIKRVNRLQIFDTDYIIPNSRQNFKNRFIFYLQTIQNLLQEPISNPFSSVNNTQSQIRFYKRPKSQQKRKLQVQKSTIMNMSSNIGVSESKQLQINFSKQPLDPSLNKYQIEEQLIHVNAQRRQVVKKNEKFMKDARARFVDNRRIFIEKDLKKS